jgi:hypothetical protein
MDNLDLQQLARLLYLFVGLILVTLVGLIIYVIVANRRERAKLSKAYEDAQMAPRQELFTKGRILSLVRDVAGEPLQVEISGAKFRSLAEIEDPKIRRQVVSAAMEMIQFTGVLGHDVTAPAPMAKTHNWREDVREDSQAELERITTVPGDTGLSAQAPAATQEVEERFLNLLSELGRASSSPERPSVISAVQQRLTSKQVAPDRHRTFVDDIEDIIQRRIQLIPALAGRDLHVEAGPGGSVQFGFEGAKYANLEEVPNLTARQLIKDAIQEWNETT